MMCGCRSAARKTRRKKLDAVQEMEEQVQILGQQNRNLIAQLNSIIVQVIPCLCSS